MKHKDVQMPVSKRGGHMLEFVTLITDKYIELMSTIKN